MTKALAWFQRSPKKLEQEKEPTNEIGAWVSTILIYLFAATSLVQAFVIPTGSMENNLLVGDHLLVDKLSFAPHGSLASMILPYTEIKRGDIIVFRYPVNLNETFVKRVIGVPGDHIRLVDKQVFLNGSPLNEPYKVHMRPFPDPYTDTWPAEPDSRVEAPGVAMLENNVKDGEVIVPANSYFAMGDNRDNSLDSRFWGFVPRENIIGKPWFIYWSYEASTEDLSSGNIGFGHIVDIVTHFYSKTRWDRSFRLIRGYQHPIAN